MIKAAARFAAAFLPQTVRATLARYRFGHAPGAASIALTRTDLGGSRFRVALTDGPAFTLTADLEPDFLDHFVTPGDSLDEMAGFLAASRASPPDGWLVDLGSNKGLFALVYLLSGARHRALLVEPSPTLCRDARALLELNGVSDRATIVVAGAASESGTRPVILDALGFARIVNNDPTAIAVPFRTVDELCATHNVVPSIVKVDIEGGEADALRGAVNTLRTHRPVLSLELHLDVLERAGEPIGPALADLSSAGYRFETPLGKPLPEWRLRHSLKAIERIVAR